MYKDFFGLTNKVFSHRSGDSGTFMGQEQARIAARLTAALCSGDTIVTVTGPVGCGKTTLVDAALSALSNKQVVAKIARIRLGHDEVLELLLTELGVKRQPAGTIQRFTRFKQLLKAWQDRDTHVFIVVEDAVHIGVDALTELESLTCEGAGGATGASIILMGSPELNDRLNDPELARTKQRTGARLVLEPFCASEIQEYLAHRFAAAGGDVAALLDDGAVDMIHRCAGGSPRVIDKLCEAALNAAAEARSKLISADLVQQVARDEFDLEPANASMEPAAVPAMGESPITEQTAAPLSEPATDVLVDTEAPSAATIMDAVFGLSAETGTKRAPGVPGGPEYGATLVEPQVPEVLTKSACDADTGEKLDNALRPDTDLLKILEEFPSRSDDATMMPLCTEDPMPIEPSPVLRTSDNDPVPSSEDCQEPDADALDVPTLSESMRVATLATANTTTGAPDPTTPCKPDIQALKSALETARKGPVDLDSPADAAPILPAITLENRLSRRVHESIARREKIDPVHAARTNDAAREQEKPASTTPVKPASDLGKARSLEEIDDIAAETLFGDEFSQFSADVPALAKKDSANDASMSPTPPALAPGNETDEPAANTTNQSDSQDAAQDTAKAKAAEHPPVPFESVTPADTPPAPDIDSSASRRFAMLRAMNESTADVSVDVANLPDKKRPQLKPIENEYGSSISQTLEALGHARQKRNEEDDDKHEQSSGFLSRFKRP